MGDWGLQDIFSAALRVADAAYWEDISYNGVEIRAKVSRTPQTQTQSTVTNFEYTIETDLISEPVNNAAVIFTEDSGPVECFSGQAQERITTLTWVIDCPRKG